MSSQATFRTKLIKVYVYSPNGIKVNDVDSSNKKRKNADIVSKLSTLFPHVTSPRDLIVHDCCQTRKNKPLNLSLK